MAGINACTKGSGTFVPRLLIAGTHSGVGKTTVTLGLLQAFLRQGKTVQPFKVGPDYIDPSYHSRLADRPCRNLDTWLIPRQPLIRLFERASLGADLAVIEGVMGLYDGIGATADQGSTAELAKILDCPVLLVLDASALSRSAAAMVRGMVDFDRRVRVVGCFLNRVGGPGHYRLVKEGIERFAKIPVVGYLPKDERLYLPERHLGLIPSHEDRGWRKMLGPLAVRFREGVDLKAIERLAGRAVPLHVHGARHQNPETFKKLSHFGTRYRIEHRVPIAVAMDEAFHFYYPENLELLEEVRAEVVPFSPLKDRSLPAGVAALYLGGGFPEEYAAELSRNQKLFAQMRQWVKRGIPTYAECGGLMVLTQAIVNGKGKRFPMIGLLPGSVRMTDRLQNFGYHEARAIRPTVLAQKGEVARGHEFHHSVWEVSRGVPGAYRLTSPYGGKPRLEGYVRDNLLASYVHLHFLSQPRWIQRFVLAARKFLAMTVVLFPLTSAFAEEPTRMEEVVVTATKARIPAKEVTRAVSVIPAEKLSVVKGGFVSGAFENVPETLVRRTGAIGRTTAVVVRGASAPQVHVTLDGAHVASPTLGSFDFNHFTPDNLDRIEILRGPSSTLYGSDAMGGVINLITRRGEGPLKYSYTQEFGGQDTFREVGSLSGEVGNWNLSSSISRIGSDGLSQNDDYENANVSARVGYDFTDETRLDFSLRHLFAIVGLDDGSFRPDPNRRDRDRLTIATGKLEYSMTPWWSQMFRFSGQIGNLIDSDPSNGGTEADSLTKLDTERYGAEWMHRLTPVEWDSITFGLEWEDREADRRTGGANRNFSKTQTTRALYLQNQWQPLDPLTIVAGLRVFRESAFGFDEVFDGSAAYFVEPWNLKLRGGYGQGFRAPSLNELFFPNFGNQNLAAEKSETFEIGADQALLDDRVQWSGTLFRTDYDDLIQIVRISSTRSEPQNVGRSRVDGVELELEFKPLPPWTLTGSYGHLEAKERPSGEELLRLPKNTMGFSVGFAPSHKKWETRLEGLLVSSREESTATNSRNKTKGYLKLDMNAQYRFWPWMKGYLRVENLTDRKYQEVLGFPANGTVASIGVTVER